MSIIETIIANLLTPTLIALAKRIYCQYRPVVSSNLAPLRKPRRRAAISTDEANPFVQDQERDDLKQQVQELTKQNRELTKQNREQGQELTKYETDRLVDRLARSLSLPQDKPLAEMFDDIFPSLKQREEPQPGVLPEISRFFEIPPARPKSPSLFS